MNQVVKSNVNFMPTVEEFNNITAVCKALSACPYYQKLGMGGILAIWLTSRELNLPPMMALNGGMYTFSGLVSLSSQMMNMMIVNAGHRADIIELTESKCHIRFCRTDRKQGHGDTFDYVYTIEMAQKAGYLGKDNWRKSPRDMLFSRCLSGGARKFMPDVLMNSYVHGELEDDGHLLPSHADVVAPQMAIEQQAVTEEPKQIAFTKAEGFDEFVQKHELFADENDNGNSKMSYIAETCDKSNLSFVQVVNSAIKHEKFFEERYEKWRKERETNQSEQ